MSVCIRVKERKKSSKEGGRLRGKRVRSEKRGVGNSLPLPRIPRVSVLVHHLFQAKQSLLIRPALLNEINEMYETDD